MANENKSFLEIIPESMHEQAYNELKEKFEPTKEKPRHLTNEELDAAIGKI